MSFSCMGRTFISPPRPPCLHPFNRVKSVRFQNQPGGIKAMSVKWRTLLVLALAELLAMGLWFSASAVVPLLTRAWSLDDNGRAWLTLSVQLGFVLGAFLSALLNLSDILPTSQLFAIAALIG